MKIIRNDKNANEPNAGVPGITVGRSDRERSGPGPEQLLNEVVRSAEDLRQRMEAHRQLVIRLLGDDPTSSMCLDADCSKYALLKSEVAATIAILENTRRSFKSKQLEVLRKRLMRVLVGLD